MAVGSVTVKHLVVDKLAGQIKDCTYYICLNEKCDVVYFIPESNVSYSKQQIKVPIWFKKDANPKFICYCNKVTEEQIIDAVVNRGAKDIKDIIKLTGAMKNGKCEYNNPLGKCCSPIIQDTINKALETREDYKNADL